MSGLSRKADLFPAVVSGLQCGWSLLRPLPRRQSLEQRLAVFPTENLPIEAPMTVHWDNHQIPFVEAQTDGDLAFAVGMAHAHLRLGQMEMTRRIAQGRVAEMAGPLAVDIDHSMRILDLGHAVPEMIEKLPDDTRAWLDNFVRGLNHYVQRLEVLPREFALFGMKRERWTVEDVLIVGRLTATDVNWLVWLPLLKLRSDPQWPQLWQRLVETGGASLPSFRKPGRLAFLSHLLGGLSRSGSNAMVISPRNSNTGAALIANDPHLNIMLPNLWIIIGCKSPSHHMVGLMLPGLPFTGLGRNPWISWGGTNMRAASSDLYDTKSLRPDEIQETRQKIRVRGWFDRTVTTRRCAIGPILSDAPLLKEHDAPPCALRWLGHDASDELTAMLRMNRAKNWQEFHDSFSTFAVPGLNMLYADVHGNIGQVMAVHLPRRANGKPDDLVLDPAREGALWRGKVTSADLPTSYNPRAGFLVSANNRPADADVDISFFFAPDDRMERIETLLGRPGKIGLSELRSIHRDVHMSSAIKLNDLFVGLIGKLGDQALDEARAQEMMRLLQAWDGNYDAESRGALAFELLLFQFTRLFSGETLAEYAAAAHSGVVRLKALLFDDMGKAEDSELKEVFVAAVKAAAPGLDKFRVWGDMHRLALDHPLAAVPVVGLRYRFGDYPSAGSSDTVMKTSHGLTDKRHTSPYGAVSRHISDLSDMDRNFFVLLGGQDGWINSSTFVDQVKLWHASAYIQVPLRLSTVRSTFPHKSRLKPAKKG